MADHADLTQDERTGLEIVEVPQEHSKLSHLILKHFAHLRGSVIHWFGVVNKFNHMWKPQRRVAIFSDLCVYLCNTDGGITRCIHVADIHELVISENHAIGFRVASPDYDMLLTIDGVDGSAGKERETIVRIVESVYWRLKGVELKVKRPTGDSGEVMHQNLQLKKPSSWQLKVTPIKSSKALSAALKEKRDKEDNDRAIVEQEFNRIKAGLAKQLEEHRSEEYERMQDRLAQFAQALSEKDREIESLKKGTVALDDPEISKACVNCANLKKVLESSSNDDKQKILRLERDIESQRNISEHLQAAIQHRTVAARQGLGDNRDSAQSIGLQQELQDAHRRNKELLQVIQESPYLTKEVKQFAAGVAKHRDGPGTTGSYSGRDWAAVVEEKDREVSHLKSVLRDATFRHVQEIDNIRAGFQRYDTQIVDYLEKVFKGQVQAPHAAVGSAAQMAQSTAAAARQVAMGGDDSFGLHAADGARGGSGSGSVAGGYGTASPARQLPQGNISHVSPITQQRTMHHDAASPGGAGGYASAVNAYNQPHDFAVPAAGGGRGIAQQFAVGGARQPGLGPMQSGFGHSPASQQRYQ
jgi:hypothetical protein